MRQIPATSILLALLLSTTAIANADDHSDAKLAAAFDKALSKLPKPFSNERHVHDGAKTFTDAHNDAAAVAFLKKVALEDFRGRMSLERQLAGFIGLALLAGKHDTATFLKSQIGTKKFRYSPAVFLGVTHLPTKVARKIAEEMAADAKLKWTKQLDYLQLLRAVGDADTLKKLKALPRDTSGKHVLQFRDRTAWYIKKRLSLKKPEQDRWARQELLFVQIGHWGPGFRSVNSSIRWGAQQIHSVEKDFSVDLLKAKLSVDRDASGWLIQNEVPVAAVLASLQKNNELLPLIEQWGERDYGYVRSVCLWVAKQMRGKK